MKELIIIKKVVHAQKHALRLLFQPQYTEDIFEKSHLDNHWPLVAEIRNGEKDWVTESVSWETIWKKQSQQQGLHAPAEC